MLDWRRACTSKGRSHMELKAPPTPSPPTPSASPSPPSPPPPSFSKAPAACLLLINRAIAPPRHPPASTAAVDSHRLAHLHNLALLTTAAMLFSTDDEHTADLSYDFDVSALANALRAHAGCRFGR
ncbi:hypothetical protein ZWY2020_025865 [Hordeum vulgare]|nr:hypothetical protein ZWY2020_025865 [Hordeum vulgare]